MSKLLQINPLLLLYPGTPDLPHCHRTGRPADVESFHTTVGQKGCVIVPASPVGLGFQGTPSFCGRLESVDRVRQVPTQNGPCAHTVNGR